MPSDYIVFGNGIFLSATGSKAAISSDGINWTTFDTVNSIDGERITFGGGYFWKTNTSSSEGLLAYSSDGINWTRVTLTYSGPYYGAAYGDDKFITIKDNSDKAVCFTTGNDCYTLSNNPNTNDTIYSDIGISSELTITSVNTNSITLNDNNTYLYTPAGNKTIGTPISQVHPDWLFNINALGVKFGNISIADNSSNCQLTTNLVTSVSSESTNDQYPSAKLFYDTCGDIQSLINPL